MDVRIRKFFDRATGRWCSRRARNGTLVARPGVTLWQRRYVAFGGDARVGCAGSWWVDEVRHRGILSRRIVQAIGRVLRRMIDVHRVVAVAVVELDLLDIFGWR